MRLTRPQPAVLVAGVGTLLLGVLLLLDDLGTLELGLGGLAPAVLALLGATLLVSGLTRERPGAP